MRRPARRAILAACLIGCASSTKAAGLKADDLFAPAAHHKNKLDLDIYRWEQAPIRSPTNHFHVWIPGDPRADRGQPSWVKHFSHVGYAGLGAAGLAASIASGGVAPAIGFGIVTFVQAFFEAKELQSRKNAKRR